MSLDLTNTEIAFKGMDDFDLKHSYLLFKCLSYSPIVKLGPKLASMAMKAQLPVKGLIKKTFFKQFCGGESIADCQATIDRLKAQGVGTILDYSAEGFATEESFNKTLKETLLTIDAASRSDAIPFCVFKPTGIGSSDLMAKASQKKSLTADEKAKLEKLCDRLTQICAKAHSSKVQVFMDAEEAAIQGFLDEQYLRLASLFNQDKAILFTTAQMYRKDRLDYLRDLSTKAQRLQFKVGVKLVRGAYWEKETALAREKGLPSPLFAEKKDTDRAYDDAIYFTTEHLDIFSVCAGTHNEFSTALLAKRVEDLRLKPKDPRISFAQLLGMSDHLTYNLAAMGYNAAKYVPYGPVQEVLPYLSRRAEENASIKGQTGRELQLLRQEMLRRRKG